VEAVKTSDEEGNYDSTMDDPTYQLLGRLGEMYRDGGHGLDKNPSKAGTIVSFFFFLFFFW
jgi:elongation factor 2 kinase